MSYDKIAKLAAKLEHKYAQSIEDWAQQQFQRLQNQSRQMGQQQLQRQLNWLEQVFQNYPQTKNNPEIMKQLNSLRQMFGAQEQKQRQGLMEESNIQIDSKKVPLGSLRMQLAWGINAVQDAGGGTYRPGGSTDSLGRNRLSGIWKNYVIPGNMVEQLKAMKSYIEYMSNQPKYNLADLRATLDNWYKFSQGDARDYLEPKYIQDMNEILNEIKAKLVQTGVVAAG